jgi:hypothetical protein
VPVLRSARHCLPGRCTADHAPKRFSGHSPRHPGGACACGSHLNCPAKAATGLTRQRHGAGSIRQRNPLPPTAPATPTRGRRGRRQSFAPGRISIRRDRRQSFAPGTHGPTVEPTRKVVYRRGEQHHESEVGSEPNKGPDRNFAAEPGLVQAGTRVADKGWMFDRALRNSRPGRPGPCVWGQDKPS